MRKLLVVLVLLVLLLIGADRIALAVAESTIASGVQKSQNLDSKPSVSIDGFPFLTQLISGHFDGVRVTAKNLTSSQASGSVRVAELKAHATDLRTSRDFKSVTAGQASGSALFSYADLSEALQTTISYGGSGLVKASGSVQALGQSVTGTVTAEMVLTGTNKIGFRNVHVQGVNIPQPVTDALTKVFADELTIDQLPVGLRLTTITSAAAGVTATVAGTDVSLK